MPIPSYPVIIVDVRPDGSAHVNVAGRHIDYPSGPIPDTRAAVTRYAVELAQTMGRPVRMNTTDPQGTWNLAVHPDGTVTDLALATTKPKRRRKIPLDQKPATTTTTATATATAAEDSPPLAIPVPAAITTPPALPSEVYDDIESTRLTQQTPSSPVASLMFSTGETVTLSGSAIVGRQPTSDDSETVDQLVSINDESRTVSKAHFRIEWNDATLWITDQQSGNGTSVQRTGIEHVQLTPWEPYALQHGDVVHIGDPTFTVSLQPSTGPTEDGR